MKTTYSVINISSDPPVPVEGLTGITYEEAISWIIEMDDIINYTIQEDIL